MKPADAAAQLGMGTSYFEEVRAGLVRLGLVVQVSVAGSRCDFWFPRLPDGMPAAPPSDISQDERRAWLRRWADELDEFISPGKAGPKWYRPQFGKAGPNSPEKPGSPTQLSPAFPEAEPGKAGASEHENGASDRPSETLKAVSQEVRQGRNGKNSAAKGGVRQKTQPTIDELRTRWRQAAENEKAKRQTADVHDGSKFREATLDEKWHRP
jgi:hypothetical protein